ncbi:ADP-ribose pyrophosphatase YjhB (NUDIX family) [Salinibacter ruber]|nr:ADP-ribose pyrophosphatase YjhB (NUDIX family) [Salinibacter ruber]
MKLNEKSHRLQFIGGTVRKGETFETALVRELNEEVPRSHLSKDRDYEYSKIVNEPLDSRFVSPSYGSYRKYSVQYYYIKISKNVDFHGSLRWVSMEELAKGETRDGVKTVPPKDIFNDKIKDKIEKLPYSIEKTINVSRRLAEEVKNETKNEINIDEVKISDIWYSLSIKETVKLIGFVITVAGTISAAAYYIGKAVGS